MAYRVNVYFNSEYIASTNIRSGSFINVTRNYGDDAYIADGFTNPTTFTATPADGCECTGWYYRIGGDAGTLTFSEGTTKSDGTNYFTYSGTDEIIIRAVGQPISGGGGDSGGGDDGGTSITKWDWYSSNGSNASASQTISAYNAINGTGVGRSTKNFSHNVWNDMVDKVKAICDEAVGWWDSSSYGLSYANTKAIANSNGEYVLTAKMFNTLRNNLEIAGGELGISKISSGTSSGKIPHPVNSGDTVYGHYFETLADYINDCIDNF